MSKPNQYQKYLPDRYTGNFHAGESSSQRNNYNVTQASLKTSARTSTRAFPSSPSSVRKHSFSNGGAGPIQHTSLLSHLKTADTKTPKINPFIMDHPQHTHYPQHGRRSSTPDRTITSTSTGSMPCDRSRTTSPLREQPLSTSNSNHSNNRPPSPRSQRKLTHTPVTDTKRYLNSDTAVSLSTLDSPSKRHDVDTTLSSTTRGLSLKDSSTFTLSSHQGLVGLRNLGNTVILHACYLRPSLNALLCFLVLHEFNPPMSQCH